MPAQPAWLQVLNAGKGPTELVICDFDGTLYSSDPSPDGNPSWYFHAHSLIGWGPPGYDSRWNLTVLLAARRASLRGDTAVVLLTSRRDHREMREVITLMLASTEAAWSAIILRPVLSDCSGAEYKARAVERLIEAEPTIRKVTMYDDQPENIEAVRLVVTLALGRQFIAG